MKAYTKVEKVWLCMLLIIALDGVAQSASCPSQFKPSKSMWCPIGSWMGPIPSEHLEEESACS